MNNECHGDAYPLFGRYWYRCFADGKTFELSAADIPARCPGCKRRTDGAVHRKEPKTRVVTVTHVRLPPGGNWVKHSEETV